MRIVNERENFTTPSGRLVQGSIWDPQTEDYATGKPLVHKTGALEGQPRFDYFFAIAIKKDHPEWPGFWNKVHGVATRGYPGLFNADGSQKDKFSFKYRDGDSLKEDEKGRRMCDREGFAGCHIITPITHHKLIPSLFVSHSIIPFSQGDGRKPFIR